MKNEISLASLITLVLSAMMSRGYSKSMILKHKVGYGRLIRYCDSIKAEEYSVAIGESFIEFVKKSNPNLSRNSLRCYESSVRRLDCMQSGAEWKPKYYRRSVYKKSRYDNVIVEFEEYLQRAGKTQDRVRQITGRTAEFLANIEQWGCNQIRLISAKIIIAGFEQATDKPGFRDTIGTFFQYAFNYGLTTQNLRHLIPTAVRHQGVPSVYTPEEVERLLASVDRSTPIGKRNYAIILIAARLGLRTSDIAELRFENLKTDSIEIVQAKTNQQLNTVFTDEVKEAVRDYIDNGRPISNDEHVFLDYGGNTPITCDSISMLTRRTFALSGINCESRKKGAHALRSSLATALLAEGNDYPTIQQVLGQKNIESTRFYARADIEQLRNHAIFVPPPSGNFAMLLAGEVCAK